MMQKALPACPTDNELTEYLVAPRGSSAVEDHLDGCASCRTTVATLAEMAFDSLPPRAPVEGESEGAGPALGVESTVVEGASGDDAALLPRGTRVGRYVVLEAVGAGAMGTVYAAQDPELGRKIALKVLRADLCSGPRAADLRERLAREARIMARLSHPDVITVHDAGTFGEQVFVAMEFVDGGTLRDWLAAAPRSWRETLDVFLHAGRGLAAAHAVGLVHRDFKPDNVLVGTDGRVRVSDFGLAREGAEVAVSVEATGSSVRDEDERPDALPRSREGNLTAAGALVGTPVYMAPEQLDGRGADARSDVFAFCVALHEALCGARPFQGATRAELAKAVTRGMSDEALRSSGVPPWVRRALARGLLADPDARCPSMNALLADLLRDPARRRRAVGLGAVVALLVGAAVTVGYAARPTMAPACGGSEAKLVGVWDAGRREQVHAALLATSVPWAEQAWTGAARALDAWSRSFSAMDHEACLARARGEQTEDLFERRTVCLSRDLDRARATVELLARADADVARHAVESAEALPSIAGCADAAALLALIPPPKPGDRPQIDALRRRLDTVDALQRAGKPTEARADLEQITAEAKDVTYAPTLAEISFRRGVLDDQLDRRATAEQALFESLWAAEAGGDDDHAARAWIWLVSTAAHQQRFAEGRRNARHAAAALARLGGSERREADLENHLGYLAEREGKYAEALTHYDRDLAYRQGVSAGSVEVAVAHQNLGLIAFRRGDYPRAEAELTKALAIEEPVLGPTHPNTLEGRETLAAVLMEAGRLDEAIAVFRAVLAIRVSALGPEHTSVAKAEDSLSIGLVRTGQYDDALGHAQRAVALHEKLQGPDSADLSDAIDLLAGVLQGLGRYDEALVASQRALAIRVKIHGAEHPKVASSLDNVGSILLSLGRVEEAIDHHRRALAISTKVLGPEHPNVGFALCNLGDDLLVKHRYDDALAAYTRAVAIWEKAMGPELPLLGSPLTGLGRVRLATGAADQAVPLLSRALTLRAKGDIAERAETELALAQALDESHGDRERARALAAAAGTDAARVGKRGEASLKAAKAFLAVHGPI